MTKPILPPAAWQAPDNAPPRQISRHAIGYCPRCKVDILEDKPNRCGDPRCPPMVPIDNAPHRF